MYQPPLAVLENAVNRSQTENVNTPEVFAALDFLGARATITWPFEQYRKALASKEGEFDFDKEGRRQVLNASLNGIKRAIPSGTEAKWRLKICTGAWTSARQGIWPDFPWRFASPRDR